MPAYSLAPRALKDVSKIIADLHRDKGPESATSIESQLFAEFEKLGRMPGIGHPRFDLTPKKVLFYFSPPYMIVYLREAEGVRIARVIHGSRDLPKLL